MTKDKALRLAVAALKKSKDSLAEELSDWAIDPPLPHVLEAHDACEQTIKVCEEALAQPEPELTAKLQRLLREDGYLTNGQAWDLAEKIAPFCAHPNEWQDLTHEEMLDEVKRIDPDEQYWSKDLARLARAIEAKLKKKNT